MRDYTVKAGLITSLIIFVIGFSIFIGVYFGIYYPLLVREFRETECVVADVKTYLTYDYYYHSYVQYKLNVYVDGEWLPGYACESSWAEDTIIDNMVDSVYPYQFAVCYNSIHEGTCYPNQLFLPRWMCLPLQGPAMFEVDDRIKCWWHYYDWNDPYSNDQPSSESKFSYPRKGEHFLEVMFKDVIYLPINDYNSLWVMSFGMCSVIPFLLIFFLYLPMCCDCYSERNFDSLKDFFEIVFCFRCRWRCLGKRRFFVRRRHRKNPPIKSRIEKLGPWMFAAHVLASKGFDPPKGVLREIAGYLDC